MSLNDYESWGRYPKQLPAQVEKLFWRSEIPDFNKFSKPVLPYGCGKSYGDSCLNENGVLLDTRGINRFISFDREKGILRCEAGVTLEQILDFALPLGWFPATTPGTKLITVGGALANDVHGKNHHKGGTFGRHVRKFELVRSNGERIICSPEENSDMFSATISGLGLTGLITWMEIQLSPCPSEFFAMEAIKFDRLEEFYEINQDSEKDFDYTVAWVDCTARGSSMGRGIYNRGNHADPKKMDIPEIKKKPPKALPIEAPFINSCTVNAFNKLYFNKQMNKIEKDIVHYDPFFYPLDTVYHWNRAYGKNGFLQYQFVIPFGKEQQTYKKFLEAVAVSGLSSFLVVMKTFGDVVSPGMMSFPRPGVNMAIDFRMTGEKTLKLLDYLDKIVREANGGFYPAKDARMSSSDFKRFYPRWKEFLQYKDTNFSSSFWRRVCS